MSSPVPLLDPAKMFLVMMPDARDRCAKRLYKPFTGRAVPPATFGPYLDLLKEYDGMIVEVETEHLFDNQFNTRPLKVGDNGLRIHETEVEAIINDFRIFSDRCEYCGKSARKTPERKCLKCGHNMKMFHTTAPAYDTLADAVAAGTTYKGVIVHE